ncbi:MAG TPA: HEPN domain-containing protein [Ignavibacteria bacterium]|nr:HEPN domain-containing protein [Ignavibacteria bacterium]
MLAVMDINKQIEYWKKGAESDVETAGILIDKKKYLHGLFFCHLSIEKILKANFVKQRKTIAPKTHDLIYLAEQANLKLNENDLYFLPILMKYQLEGRYPEYSPFIPSKEQANEYLNKTKDLLKWLTQKL